MAGIAGFRERWMQVPQSNRERIVVAVVVAIAIILLYRFLTGSSRQQQKTERTSVRQQGKTDRRQIRFDYKEQVKLAKIEADAADQNYDNQRKICKSTCRLNIFRHDKCMSDCYSKVYSWG